MPWFPAPTVKIGLQEEDAESNILVDVDIEKFVSTSCPLLSRYIGLVHVYFAHSFLLVFTLCVSMLSSLGHSSALFDEEVDKS